jgi:hypothetical protein
MSQIVFVVEQESSMSGRWCIKRDGVVRARYRTRLQAVIDAKQLASFEKELRGGVAFVRVLDSCYAVGVKGEDEFVAPTTSLAGA